MLRPCGLLLALCAVLSLSLAAVAEEGIVLHYAFSEGRGNVLNDTSGNGNDGKIADAHWLKGKNGFALRFNGANSYVQCGNGNSLGLSGPLTLAFWVFREPGNPHQNKFYVMGKADYNVYLTAKGNVGFTTISNAPEKKWTTLTSKEVLPLGQWSFVAVVYDKAVRTERIYINGVLDTTRQRLENPDLWVEVPVTLVIGTGRYGADRKMFFPGALADVRIYSRALSAEEIQTLAKLAGATKDKNMLPVVDVGFRPLPFFVGKNLHVHLDLAGAESLPFDPSIEVQLFPAGRTKAVQTLVRQTLRGQGRVAVTMPSADLAPGEYEIHATLRGRDLAPVAAGTFKIPKYPARPYIGLMRTPDDRPTVAVPARLTLNSDKIECELSPATGQVVRVDYLPKNLRVVIENHDIYVFGGKDGDRILETADKVIGFRWGAEGKPDGFELICTNPGLPDVELTKAYRLEKQHLVKVVYFRATSDRNDGKLVFYRSALKMDPEFYKDGWHYRPMWDGGSGPGTGSVPFVAASAVKSRTAVRDLNSAFFAYFQPKDDLLLSQYRAKINGHFERFYTIAFQPETIDDQGYFDPQGWEEYVSGDVIREGYFLSCETHLAVLEGDARALHEHQISLPEMVEMSRSKVPEWWTRVKTVGCYDYDSVAYGTGWIDGRLANLLADFAADEMLPAPLTDVMITGDYASKGLIMPLNRSGHHPAPRSADTINADLHRLHQIDPERVRLGLYTWHGSASDKSQTCKQHPEWLLRNQNGDLCQYGSGETYNYFLNCVTQDQVDFILNQRREMLKNYDVDLTYVDGGHCEAINFFPEMNYVHNYHSHIILRGMKMVAEEMGKIHFQNGGCYPDTSHGGYFEFGSPSDPVDRKDWRTMANAAYIMARCMRPPNASCLLYWNSQGHSNHYAMYGLKPHLGTLWTSLGLAHTLLMADLSFEIKDSEILVNDNVHPNWWKFETTTLESAFLKQGKSYLLPVVNHGLEDKTENVTVSLAGLDLHPNAPVYAWQIQPLIPHANYSVDWTKPLRETMDAVAYQFDTLKSNHGALTVTVPAMKYNLLRMVTLSQTPGFVYAVDGRRMHYLMSTGRGVAIDGKLGRSDVTLSVRSKADAAEILAMLPAGWKQARATVNGQPAACEALAIGPQVFGKVAVAKGASQVVILQAGGNTPPKRLTSPTRNEYRDYALSYLPDLGVPKIVADQFDGLPCWKMTGKGRLVSPFNSEFKGTKGVAFKLNPGTAKGKVGFKYGNGASAFIKEIPLDFTGWKKFTILENQFDTHPKAKWDRTTSLCWMLPEGSVYVSDFRFISRPSSDAIVPKVARKRAEIPCLAVTPTLNGTLKDEAWSKAARLDVPGGETVFFAGYDRKNLYIAARSNEAILRPPPKPARDSRMCTQAPNIEIYVMPKGVNKVYQFCLTAGGGQWDAIYNDPKVRWGDTDWNGTWKGATGFEFQMDWLAEVAIPFSDFGLAPPQKGDVWLIGLFRQGGSAGLSGWAYKGGNFCAPDENFGEFVFVGQ
jgi:hypothetical protein